MMDCKHIEELLMEYLYQELDPAQAEHVETHLRACSRCAQELASYEATRAAMRELPELEPRKGVEALLLQEAARAARPEASSFWERFSEGLRVLILHPAMTGAVTLVVVLGVSFYVYRQGVPRPASEPEVPQFETDRPSRGGAVPLLPQGAEERAAMAGAPSVVGGTDTDQEAKKELDTREGATRLLRFKDVTQRAATGARKLSPAEGLRENVSLEKGPRERRTAGGMNAPAPATPEPLRGKGERGARDEEAKSARPAKKSVKADAPDELALGAGRARGDVSVGALQEGRRSELKEAQEVTANRAPKARPAPSPAVRAGKPLAKAPVGWSQADDVVGRDAKQKKVQSQTPGAPRRMSQSPAESARDQRGTSRLQGVGQQRAASQSQRAAEWIALGDKASAAGNCSLALSYYDRALEAEPKLLPQVSAKVRPCATLLARDGDAPLLRAQNSYRNLSKVLGGELQAVRRVRANRSREASQAVDAQKGKRAEPAPASTTKSY